MSSLAVLGCMWGDEAKAKIVDYLGDRADYVVRFQGGSNAGHTIHHAGQKYVFHSVPSGILYPASKCVIASGVVIDPFSLVEEIEALAGLGIDFTDRFFIDSRAGLVLPLHQELDNRSESSWEIARSYHQARDRPGLCRYRLQSCDPFWRSGLSGLAKGTYCSALSASQQEYRQDRAGRFTWQSGKGL
jgi:hypothetical protein